MGRVAQFFIILVGLIVLTGCVERKLTIKSTPSEARLYVNYAQRGQTPRDVPFTHYGTHVVRLEKPGYITKLETIHLQPSWYSYFPINLFSEVLLPFTIVDHRKHSIELTPYQVPSKQTKTEGANKREQILDRAEELRREHPSYPSENSSSDQSDDE